ncbi:MAG: Histidine kinase [Gemmatimonadetes bacterium]|nr:Histidine kinase [Gemmatimonadota bacterium]
MSSIDTSIQSPSASVATSLLHEALDALTDHIALIGPTGEILAVNRAWTEFAEANGHQAGGTALGRNLLVMCGDAERTQEESARNTARGLKQVLAGELELFQHEYGCHSAEQDRWFLMTVRRVSRAGPVAAIITIANRTAERLAERAELDARAKIDAIRQAADCDRRRLEATLEALPVGVWLSDADGRITHSNPAAMRIWGGAAPLPGRQAEYCVYRAWSPRTGEMVRPEQWPLARTLATGQMIIDELHEIGRFDGTRGYVLTSSAPILDADGALMGAVAINVDFTERQAAARERDDLVATLQRERMQLAAVFDKAPAFLAVLRGPTYVFELANEACQQLVGYRDVIGKPVSEALPELVAQGFLDILDRVRDTGEPWFGRQIPVQLARSPGAPLETRYVDLVYQRLDQPNGGTAIVSHGVDVTEQVVATESIRVSEQRLRDQFAKLPVPTYLWELRGDDVVLVDCNEAARSTLPRFDAGMLGMRADVLFPDAEDVTRDVRRSLRDNVVIRRTVETELGASQGRRRLDITIGPQQPDRVLVHAVDTTERAELEAQLRQAQKMEAVGRLAGGVAHDFNNLLTVIGAHSAFLMESLGPSDPLLEDAESIHKAGIRAAGLTRQLLAFSRKQILKPSVIDLNTTVDEARNLLLRLLGEDIEIVTALAAGPQHVVADPTQIDQVLVNLAVNARDAMPAGGRLTIATRRVTIAVETRGARSIVPAGDYVVLSVQDAGTGMDAEVKGRLFEPFFTTKEPGKGTGLGLATAYGIVQQSRGYIVVDSAPGMGSTFHVYLPAVAPDAPPEPQHDDSTVTTRGVETILIVEDERGVREVAKRVLRREGYIVLEAEDGSTALTVSAAFNSVIHLVLSDVVMPGMRGAEVVRRLQEQRPALKAIFMSGYTDDDIVRRGIGTSAMPFVQKPFTAVDLVNAVREALDA